MKSRNWWYRAANRLSLSRALLWIGISTALISGSAAIGLGGFLYYRAKREGDPRYRIVAVVQTGPEKEQLKTEYLGELLELSVDKPQNLYHFRTREAAARLKQSPLIEEASVKRVAPGTLFIDYKGRRPAAFLGDYSNTAFDKNGFLFPFKPFFTPKNLPVVTFGIWKRPTTKIWGKRLKGKKAELAYSLIGKFKKRGLALQKLDLSGAFAPSLGRREIVATLIEPSLKRELILRLSSDGWKEGFNRYLSLRRHFDRVFENRAADHPVIIDLRIPELGFIL